MLRRGTYGLDAERLGDLGLEERELLVGPARVAPLAGAQRVTVADDPHAGHHDHGALLLHRRAGLGGGVDADDLPGHHATLERRGWLRRDGGDPRSSRLLELWRRLALDHIGGYGDGRAAQAILVILSREGHAFRRRCSSTVRCEEVRMLRSPTLGSAAQHRDAEPRAVPTAHVAPSRRARRRGSAIHRAGCPGKHSTLRRPGADQRRHLWCAVRGSAPRAVARVERGCALRRHGRLRPARVRRGLARLGDHQRLYGRLSSSATRSSRCWSAGWPSAAGTAAR